MRSNKRLLGALTEGTPPLAAPSAHGSSKHWVETKAGGYRRVPPTNKILAEGTPPLAAPSTLGFLKQWVEKRVQVDTDVSHPLTRLSGALTGRLPSVAPPAQ
eukprot:1159692-Pelagomonas_calceolata.AAC.4